MFRPNSLKQKLVDGKRPVGCWVFMSGGDGTELIARMGFDFLIVDHEHISASPHSLIEHMRAAQGTDTTTLVRVPSHDPVYIKRALDAGIEGIVVPTVETADEMRAIVAACRYRPDGGTRGVGYPEIRAADWGLAEIAYARQYRERLLIAAIVETRKGAENIDEIAAVDGVDILIPGAGDLLADLIGDFSELPALGSYSHPELTRLMTKMETAIARSGKWLGGVARTAEDAGALFCRGYALATATADTWLMMDAARRVMADLGRPQR